MLFIEDRIYQMNEKLRLINFIEEGQKLVELCEDWWELLRQDATLFEVYVRQSSLTSNRKSSKMNTRSGLCGRL